MPELQFQRVARCVVQPFGGNRLPPAAFAGVPPQGQVRQRQRPLRAADLVAMARHMRVGGVFGGGKLPAPGRDHTVADRKAAQGAAGEFKDDRGAVLDFEAARLVRGDRLHRPDLSDQMAQQVDVVDQVDIDRPGALLPSPASVKVILRFVEPELPRNRDDLAQNPAGDGPGRSGDDRIVPAMMADQHRHAARPGRLQHRPGRCGSVGDGLFDQHRQAVIDAVLHVLCVHLVWRGDHHPVQRHRVQTVARCGEPWYAQARGEVPCRGRRIGDGRQIGQPPSQIDMPPPDQPRAEHGDPGGGLIRRARRTRPETGRCRRETRPRNRHSRNGRRFRS